MAPRIEGFNVDEVSRLEPGVDLEFTVYGTPGGMATLRIEGANHNLTLVEGERGRYEGTYTLGNRDHITGRSSVTANLRTGNRVASSVLSESLLRNVGSHNQANTMDRDHQGYQDRQGYSPLKIDRFDMSPSNDLSGGTELTFTLHGTPGAKADMTIVGTKGIFFLPEVRTGEYAGTYTVRRYDKIEPNSVVTANLRRGDRVVTTTLGKPLMVARAKDARAARVVTYCANCATVTAVNVVEVNGDGSYLGTVGGGVVGALLGSQVGGGNGKTAAEIAGALGGAYVGRNIENNSRKASHYEVAIRFDRGETQTVTYERNPGFRVGEKVKINDGVLTRD